MQTVDLKREILANTAVLGTMYINGVEICKTLENPWLNNVPSFSCIPTGDYICKKYNSESYSDVWEVTDVQGRTYILIHAGNTEEDTEGCILVGDRWGFLADNLAVLSSRVTLQSLRGKLQDTFQLKIRTA